MRGTVYTADRIGNLRCPNCKFEITFKEQLAAIEAVKDELYLDLAEFEEWRKSVNDNQRLT